MSVPEQSVHTKASQYAVASTTAISSVVFNITVDWFTGSRNWLLCKQDMLTWSFLKKLSVIFNALLSPSQNFAGISFELEMREDINKVILESFGDANGFIE